MDEKRERRADTGHGHGREKSEEEAQKLKKVDPNEAAERKGVSEHRPTS